MKLTQLSLLAVLLALHLVGAATIPATAVDGVLDTAPPALVEERDILSERTNNDDHEDRKKGCNADNVLRALRNPTRSADASKFCSKFIRPTEYKTLTKSNTATDTITKTSTKTQTETTSKTVTATETVICPGKPKHKQVCGFAAYGYSKYLIQSKQVSSPGECQRFCLEEPRCKSYQINLNGAQCNIFWTSTRGNVFPASQDSYRFYDRNCPDHAPKACRHHHYYDRRTYEDDHNDNEHKHRECEPPKIPEYLATVPPTRISSACKCLITKVPHPTTCIKVVKVTVTTSTTTTKPTTTTTTKKEIKSTTTTVIVTKKHEKHDY